MEKQYQKYFLGANSCEGFVSEFSGSYRAGEGWRAYIIKGGPGTGKSSFMKYLAARAEDAGYEAQLCVCSSDPQSLDGVIFPELKKVVLDGTAPHIVEPEFPGACEEIINLGMFWDAEKLFSKAEEIITVTKRNKAFHRMASRYLLAGGQMLRDNLRLAQSCTDRHKAETFAESLCRRYLPSAPHGKGLEWVRFLQGITPLGVVAYSDTVTEFYRQKIVISDSSGSVSGIIMPIVRDYALAAGYEIITVKNPFIPGELIDHVLIPQLSLAFVTETEYMHFAGSERRIHARRFMNVKQLHLLRQRMNFNRKLSHELLLEAASSLAAAKSVHDELEGYYINAMDFRAVTEFAEETAKSIIG